MKTRTAFGIAGLAMAGVLAGSGVSAQRGPMPGRQMMPLPPPIMKAGTAGLYVLAGPTLVKYDAATLQRKGSIDLVTKPGNPPGREGGRPGMPPRQPAPAELLLAKLDGIEQILIVTGDEFIRVDSDSLKVAARGKLPAPAGPGQGGQRMGPPPTGPDDGPGAAPPSDEVGPAGPPPPGMGGPGMPPPPGGPEGQGMLPPQPGEQGPGMLPPPPGDPGFGRGAGRGPQGPGMRPGLGIEGPKLGLALSGDRLYILRGPQVIAVDIKSGKVTAKTDLPKPPTPQAPPTPEDAR